MAGRPAPPGQTAEQSLAGRTALVTGSSRNLGAGIAEALARSGAAICVHYHTAEMAARSLVDRLRQETGRTHLAIQADLSTGEGARFLGQRVLELQGRVDILVNNAGPFSITPYMELAERDWDLVWGANAKATYLLSQILAAPMREAGWGRIVNISAGSAFLRNHSVYGLAKEAIIYLTEELALELGPHINVNAIAPGQIFESAEEIAAHDPTFVERAIAATPARRLVTRPEIADLVVRLCEPAFDMLTGVTLPLDGGWRLPRF